MGWHAPDKLASPFREAAASLKVGGISPVLKDSAGYDIITVIDRINAGIPPLSEVQDTVRKREALQKRSVAVEALYKDVIGGARVDVNEAVLKSIK